MSRRPSKCKTLRFKQRREINRLRKECRSVRVKEMLLQRSARLLNHRADFLMSMLRFRHRVAFLFFGPDYLESRANAWRQRLSEVED